MSADVFNDLKMAEKGLNVIFAQSIDYMVLVRTASSVKMSIPNLCFEQKYEKYHNYSSANLNFYQP